jgi:SAM-dependent methyltransferase
MKFNLKEITDLSRNTFQVVKDFVFIPLRFLVPESSIVTWLGLSTLSEVRHRVAASHCAGRILDLTCGSNKFRKWFGCELVGIDIHLAPEIDICADAHAIPIDDGVFDTVVLLASLNYMQNPEQVLFDVNRVLKPDGRVVITMISPRIGNLRVNIQNPLLGTKKNWEGKLPGMEIDMLKDLLFKTGFKRIEGERFLYRFNNLIIGYK